MAATHASSRPTRPHATHPSAVSTPWTPPPASISAQRPRKKKEKPAALRRPPRDPAGPPPYQRPTATAVSPCRSAEPLPPTSPAAPGGAPPQQHRRGAATQQCRRDYLRGIPAPPPAFFGDGRPTRKKCLCGLRCISFQPHFDWCIKRR